MERGEGGEYLLLKQITHSIEKNLHANFAHNYAVVKNTLAYQTATYYDTQTHTHTAYRIPSWAHSLRSPGGDNAN